MKLGKILKDNIWFLVPYGVLMCCCIVILCMVPKNDIHLAINSLHGPFWDQFFKWATEMGSFSVIGPCLLLMCFFSWRMGIVGALSTGLSALGTQFGKRIIWPVSPRPKVVFSDILQDLHLVEGVRLHSTHSFPSGHTTGAFALFCVCILFAKKPFWKVFFTILAIIVAYSRMYLSQHFLIDVTVGSFIGSLGAVMAFWWISQYKQEWLEMSLLTLIKGTGKTK